MKRETRNNEDDGKTGAGPIVLYDGDCGLCDWSVRFILRHEAGRVLRFAAQQTAAAQKLSRQYGVEGEMGNGVVFIEAGRGWVASTGSLRLCAYLHWPWRWGLWLLWVPRPVRDAVYRVITRNRRRWFGTPACPVGGLRGIGMDRADLQERFLGDV